MISSYDSMASVAVRDLDAAREFYEGVLGLTPVGDMMGVLKYRSGNSHVIVYVSDTAGQNPATSITWGVGDAFDAIVERLRDAGVKFERYSDLGMKVEGDVHVAGGFKAVWFRDVDGNILHVNNG
jgi:catechol 2,3-dioxygenase-like lactoylglutathione lyase family enzyme